MKRASCFMVTFLLLLSLPGRCQRLNFSGKDVPLIDIFKIIKYQTGIVFFYDAALLQNTKRLTIEWNNENLEKALNDIFKGQALTWILEDKL
jgi:iron complex outermembrane receptor protein